MKTQNASTEVATTTATPLQLLVIRALEAKLNECRRKCPGVGGDIDASNMLWLRQNGQWVVSTVSQAASRLAILSKTLEVDASWVFAALDALIGEAAVKKDLVDALAEAQEWLLYHGLDTGPFPGTSQRIRLALQRAGKESK